MIQKITTAVITILFLLLFKPNTIYAEACTGTNPGAVCDAGCVIERCSNGNACATGNAYCLWDSTDCPPCNEEVNTCDKCTSGGTCPGGKSPGDWCSTYLGTNFCCQPPGVPVPTGICNYRMGYKYDSNCNCDTSGPGGVVSLNDVIHTCDMEPGQCGCPATVVPTPIPTAIPTPSCGSPIWQYNQCVACNTSQPVYKDSCGNWTKGADQGDTGGCSSWCPPPSPTCDTTPIFKYNECVSCNQSRPVYQDACGTFTHGTNKTDTACGNWCGGVTPTPTPGTPPPGSTPTPPPACTVIKATTNPASITNGVVTLSWAMGWVPGANNHAEYINVSNSSDTNPDNGKLININADDAVVTGTTSRTRTYSPGTYYWNIVSDGCGPFQPQSKVSTPLGSFTITAPLTVNCWASPDRIPPGGNTTWTAYPSAEGSFTYVWSGTDSLSGSVNPLSASYSTIGPKYGTVTLTSGSTSITEGCSNTVTVYGNSWMQVFGDVHSKNK